MATTINGSTGASQIQDDIVTEDKLNLISTASVPSLEAKGSGSQDGYIQLNCYANTHGIKLKSPPHSAGASYTLTFPNNDGDADQFLQTNGSGVMSWAAPSGGGMTLLSTLNTTSGTTATTGTLDLTGYLQLVIWIYSVYPGTGSSVLRMGENGGTQLKIRELVTSANEPAYMQLNHNLSSGVFITLENSYGMGVNDTSLGRRNSATGVGINTAIDTATTALKFDLEGGQTFTGGSIKVYGLK